MKALVYHLQVNVSNAKESLPFYKGLLKYFDYKIIDESEEHLGASNKTTDFWIIQTERKYAKPYHRKSTGINHIAFKVSKKEDVDKFVKEFLKTKKIPTLYGTPKHYHEYREGYYAVFFEDPDRIKLEVVYIPENK